jgi:hypothetical protein
MDLDWIGFGFGFIDPQFISTTYSNTSKATRRLLDGIVYSKCDAALGLLGSWARGLLEVPVFNYIYFV